VQAAGSALPQAVFLRFVIEPMLLFLEHKAALLKKEQLIAQVQTQILQQQQLVFSDKKKQKPQEKFVNSLPMEANIPSLYGLK